MDPYLGILLEVFGRIDLDSSGTLELEELETAARESRGLQQRVVGVLVQRFRVGKREMVDW